MGDILQQGRALAARLASRRPEPSLVEIVGELRRWDTESLASCLASYASRWRMDAPKMADDFEAARSVVRALPRLLDYVEGRK